MFNLLPLSIVFLAMQTKIYLIFRDVMTCARVAFGGVTAILGNTQCTLMFIYNSNIDIAQIYELPKYLRKIKNVLKIHNISHYIEINNQPTI